MQAVVVCVQRGPAATGSHYCYTIYEALGYPGKTFQQHRPSLPLGLDSVIEWCRSAPHACSSAALVHVPHGMSLQYVMPSPSPLV